jgi:hypothetical protein
MVLWIWRGLLKDQGVQDEYNKGWELPCNDTHCLLMIVSRVSTLVVKSLCMPGSLEGGNLAP